MRAFLHVSTAVAMLLATAVMVPPLYAAPQRSSPVIELPGLSVRGDSTSVTIILLLTLLTLLPAILLSVTPFVRILVVFHFLRQALGTQSTPSNQVLLGLSLFLTMLIVSPLFTQIHDTAWVPMQQGALTQEQAIEQAGKPLSAFLLKYAREKDIKLFLEVSHAPAPRTPTSAPARRMWP